MNTMTNNNDKRKWLLKQVIQFKPDWENLTKDLLAFDWDYEGEPVFLDKENISKVLELYIEGDIEEKTVYRWADFLEVREDVDYPEEYEGVISEILLELANPDTHGRLTLGNARKMLFDLQK